MKVSLVPSAISMRDDHPSFFLSTYLIDEFVAIDAGGIGFLDDLREQQRVEHIFITHSHMDHIASLPIFLDNVFGSSEKCVTVHAGEATLASLRRDVFNDRVWPDFISMSKKGMPFVEIKLLEAGRVVEVGDLRVTPVPVDHIVPTFGFLVEGHGALWRSSRTPGQPRSSGARPSGGGPQGRVPRGVISQCAVGAGRRLQAPDAVKVCRRGTQDFAGGCLHCGAYQAEFLRRGCLGAGDDRPGRFAGRQTRGDLRVLIFRGSSRTRAPRGMPMRMNAMRHAGSTCFSTAFRHGGVLREWSRHLAFEYPAGAARPVRRISRGTLGDGRVRTSSAHGSASIATAIRRTTRTVPTR